MDKVLTNAGTQMNNTFGFVHNAQLLQPRHSVVVGAQKTMARDVLKVGNMREGTLQLLFRQIEGVVVN